MSPPDDEKDTEHADIGAQLRAAADKLGLSARQVAVRAGLPKRTVTNAFNGANITLSTLRRLVKVLAIDAIDFGDFQGKADAPDMAAARAVLDDLDKVARAVEASREAIGEKIAQRERDRATIELIRDIARDATHQK